MTASTDLFKQINNAVLDLQAAQLQTYSRPLKRLAQLLAHPDLADTNAALTEGLNLADFLKKSEQTQGGMAGDAELLWPDNPEEILGLTLLFIEYFAEDPDRMTHIGRQFYYTGSSSIMSGVQAIIGQMIIPFARDYKTFVMNNGKTQPRLNAALTNKIFIVHGHDEGARESVARFLEHIGFQPIILHEQANRGRTVIEKVEANSDVSFAVVLLTPDDEGCKKGGVLEPRTRQNVLLELGYFIGRLGRERVCALKRGIVEVPSDFAGVVWEAMDNGNDWERSLGRELAAVGHEIDWNKVMR